MNRDRLSQPSGASELLSTKLTPPHLSKTLVVRESLLARLNEGLTRKLTLISAPAGFGKTTLVSQWLSHFRFPILDFGLETDKIPWIIQDRQNPKSQIPNPAVAWVALDEGDNDPVRFWRYVLTACQGFDKGAGEPALHLLYQTSMPPFEAMLTTWINRLAHLAGRAILVLEDYHLITTGSIHDMLSFLLDHLPPALHLVLLTRADPPLPLARLRARGELHELRAVDLRFSPAEIETFLQQTLSFSLPPETVERLATRTEGWPAGLRLATLALQGRSETAEVEQFLTTFAGSHRHIMEYLAAEVVNAQPESLQTFLLQTSFLNRLTGSLCEAVTGRSDSQLLLEQLERMNLFLIPLDGARQWYRYHALFAEALRYDAQRRLSETARRELLDKASRWYETHNLPGEAIEAALAAKTFTRAAALIEQILEPSGFSKEIHTLRRWIEPLPEEILPEYPAVCLAYALALLFTEDRRAPATQARLERPLRMAEQRWQAEENQAKLGQVLALRSNVMLWQGRFRESFELARQALALLPQDETAWRGISLIILGAGQLAMGQVDLARQSLLEARACCEAAGNTHGALATVLVLGDIHAERGDLHQAERLYEEVLAEADRMGDREPTEDMSQALTGMANLAFEWNDLAKAKQQADQALELAKHLGDESLRVDSTLVAARVLGAQGEMDQAQQRLHALVAATKQPWLLREIQADLAALALKTGDLTTVERWWATVSDQPQEPLLHRQQEREELLVARLRIAQEEAAEALAILEPWRAEAHHQGRTRREIEIRLLQALAHFSQADLPPAQQALLDALTLAQPEGYCRIFLNEGQSAANLLKTVLPILNEEPLRSYAQNLWHIFVNEHWSPADDDLNKRAEIQNLKSKIQNLIEPLSPQEQRVLRLLAAGLSNAEIAEELVVSINTIKTQVKSIYRKLDVHNRDEAGEMARALELI